MKVTIGARPIVVRLGENTAAAARSAASAAASEALAEQWAENPEDTPVETGKFSAKHWARKSEMARDVVAATAVTYTSLAAATTGAADGDFFTYRDASGYPVYATKSGGAVVSLPGPYFGADKIANANGGTLQAFIDGTLVDLTVNVSSYASPQAAFDQATRLQRLLGGGARIIVHFDSGSLPTTGIFCANGDYGNIWIETDNDQTLFTHANFVGTFLEAWDCSRAPTLNLLLDMENSRTRAGGSLASHGVVFDRCGSSNIPDGMGVRNAPQINIWYRRRGHHTAQNIVSTGAQCNNVRTTHGAFADLRGADLSGFRGSSPAHPDTNNFLDAAIGCDNGRVEASLCTLSGGTGIVADLQAMSVLNIMNAGMENNTSTRELFHLDSSSRLMGGPASGAGDDQSINGCVCREVYNLNNSSLVEVSGLRGTFTGALAVIDGNSVLDTPRLNVETLSASTIKFVSIAEDGGKWIACDNSVVKLDCKLLDMSQGAEANLNHIAVSKPTTGTGPVTNAIEMTPGCVLKMANSSWTDAQGTIVLNKGGTATLNSSVFRRKVGAANKAIVNNANTGSITRANGVTVSEDNGSTAPAALNATTHTNAAALNALTSAGVIFG